VNDGNKHEGHVQTAKKERREDGHHAEGRASATVDYVKKEVPPAAGSARNIA